MLASNANMQTIEKGFEWFGFLWLNLMAIYINLTVSLLDLEIESEGSQVDHSVKHLLSH